MFHNLSRQKSNTRVSSCTLRARSLTVVATLCIVSLVLGACTSSDSPTDLVPEESEKEAITVEEVSDRAFSTTENDESSSKAPQSDADETEPPATSTESRQPTAEELRDELGIVEDFRSSFVHGDKPASCQKYIVLHDTEGDGSASSVIDWWDSNGNLVAAHFIVNKDGSIWQCAPLDTIVHHAGFGDTGHNELYGTTDESRDDKKGTSPIGDWAADYGMNSYSIGIEMVHMGGEGDYPAAQLEAVDKLIAYIDAYYGFESDIIDHKAWRSGNSDTSDEFAPYLESYQAIRKHSSS